MTSNLAGKLAGKFMVAIMVGIVRGGVTLLSTQSILVTMVQNARELDLTWTDPMVRHLYLLRFQTICHRESSCTFWCKIKEMDK